MPADAQSRPDLPIGPPVDPGPSDRPRMVTLPGRFVTIRPLVPADAESLFDTACGSGRESLWTYMDDGPFTDKAAFRQSMAQKAASADRLFFTIADNESGRAVGHAALMHGDPANRVIGIGDILYGTNLRRTPGATESMALLAGYVFDILENRRYEWRCDYLSALARTAATRLGFSFEGVFRQHRIVKNRNRDTACFSLLDTEWPACRAAFQAWLAPENFRADGSQRRSLADLRRHG